MSGSDWGRHSKSCCKTPLGNLAEYCLTNRTGLQLLLPQVCEMCFVMYQEQNKWWENVIFTIHVLSILTALLTWAASLGWTSAVTCCNIYREYHVSVYISPPPPQSLPLGRGNKRRILDHSLHSPLIFCVLLRVIICPIHRIMYK